MADIETIERETLTKVADAETIQALEDVRVSALGKKGVISERMKALGKMSPEERKTAGAALNALKDKIVLVIDEKRKKLENAELDRRLTTEKIDVTLPIAPMPKGRIHPMTQV
ncbi:MAG TPA: phenylalanine--tRNA ligase subunit alpha, partial [Parvularculaceae bacterium]|nr:phenylalanine--tRNA ligase subunit alpha [Parvularculaceae bacterium]